MNYLANDWSFVLPDVGFQDKTVHLFEARLRDGVVAGLVVSRRPLAGGKTLRKMVDEHTLEQAKLFHGFSVVAERGSADGVLEVSSRWRHDNSVVYQREAHLQDGETWMLVALRTPFEDRETCDGWMDAILESLRLRAAG